MLNDLVRELLPVLHEHLKYYAVDITTVTFNWFVTIFIDAVPFEVRGEMKRSINSVHSILLELNCSGMQGINFILISL